MNRLILFFLLLWATLMIPPAIYSQGCCGIGSALVAGGFPTLERGTFLIQSGGDYTGAENPSRSKAAGTINIAYGLTNRLALSVKTDYAWFHSSINQPAVVYNGTVLFPETTIVFDNNDISDGIIGGQFSIIPMSPIDKQELKIGADIGIPWGPDQKVQNGAELPKNTQTGSGAYTIGGFVSYSQSFPVHYLAGAATAAGRIKFKNRRDERPGNEASFLVSGIIGPFWKTRESISLNYKLTGVTYDANGTEEPATRGSRLDIIPAMEFTFTEKIKATCEALLPVWRDTYQNKFGNNIGARASMLFFIPVFSD